MIVINGAAASQVMEEHMICGMRLQLCACTYRVGKGVATAVTASELQITVSLFVFSLFFW